MTKIHLIKLTLKSTPKPTHSSLCKNIMTAHLPQNSSPKTITKQPFTVAVPHCTCCGCSPSPLSLLLIIAAIVIAHHRPHHHLSQSSLKTLLDSSKLPNLLQKWPWRFTSLLIRLPCYHATTITPSNIFNCRLHPPISATLHPPHLAISLSHPNVSHTHQFLY